MHGCYAVKILNNSAKSDHEFIFKRFGSFLGPQYKIHRIKSLKHINGFLLITRLHTISIKNYKEKKKERTNCLINFKFFNNIFLIMLF